MHTKPTNQHMNTHTKAPHLKAHKKPHRIKHMDILRGTKRTQNHPPLQKPSSLPKNNRKNPNPLGNTKISAWKYATCQKKHPNEKNYNSPKLLKTTPKPQYMKRTKSTYKTIKPHKNQQPKACTEPTKPITIYTKPHIQEPQTNTRNHTKMHSHVTQKYT